MKAKVAARELLVTALIGAVRADSRMMRCSLYRVPRALALDILFGPEEDFDYRPTTPS